MAAVIFNAESAAKEERAARYIAAIRNKDKKYFAVCYANHLRYGGCAPARPLGISFMASQAVRLELDSILA